MKIEELLFLLLRIDICGSKVNNKALEPLSMEKLKAVYDLSRKHDLTHIAGQALSNLGMLGTDDISENFKMATMQAVYRYVQMNYAYGQLCCAFESAQIPFLPLKGAVIRHCYPEPWMRTSCDIDILVHEEELERAIKVLVNELGYRNEGRGYHDVSLFSPGNIHVELHFSLMNESRFPKAEMILSDIWSDLHPLQSNGKQLQMTDELFYFYHVLHMASHFCNGGCGIKPLLDLWILNHKVGQNREKRELLLREGGLLTFEQATCDLSEVWFSGKIHTKLTQEMESYILNGGVYGTLENMAAVQQVKKGGKVKSVLYKIFLPYSLLKGHYPILKKHKWLLPFCQMTRWLRLLSRSRWKRSLRELKINAEISTAQISSTADLLKALDLQY